VRQQVPTIATASAQATAAFDEFRPSLLTDAERASGIYAAPGASPGAGMDRAIESGITALRATADDRGLRVSPDTKLTVEPAGGGAGAHAGTVSWTTVTNLIPLMTTTVMATELVTRCAAEVEVNRRLKQPEPLPPAGAGGGAPANGGAIPAAVGGGTTTSSTSGRGLRARDLVEDIVPELMTATSPEDLLSVTHPQPTLADAEKGLDTFELREGASDAVSYHDFHSLQIAFEHVWTELYDAGLANLGKQLYAEAVELERFCLPDYPNGSELPDSVKGIDDIKALLDRVASLTGTVEDNTTTASGGSLAGILTGGLYGAAGPSLTGGLSGTGGIDAQERNLADRQAKDAVAAANVIPGAGRLSRLVNEIDQRLAERYFFKVFKEGTYNFGFLVTYRQTWTPLKYQVGDLVSTMCLAPRQVRKYTTRRVTKVSRAEKELEDALRTVRDESTGTSRTERAIVDKAQSSITNAGTTTGSFGAEGSYKGDFTAYVSSMDAKQSERVKKHFHEAVLKSAQEYRQEHKVEVDKATTEEVENVTVDEIQNPNDELTVTYMLYELERTYRLSERIHQLTPVILVANKVPAPHEIDDAWLMTHDWILRRVILDDSFRPALDYLMASFTGAELNIKILEYNAQAQHKLAEDLKVQLQQQMRVLDDARANLDRAEAATTATQAAEGFLGVVKRLFDPLQITGKEALGTGDAVQTLVDYAQEALDRAERERGRLIDELGAATTALQTAIDKYSTAIKEHYARVAEIDRLRVHVKDNIIYYMQAIWSHEPRDQRYFRLFDAEITVHEPVTTGPAPTVTTVSRSVVDDLLHPGGGNPTVMSIPVPTKFTEKKRTLAELADLDTVLGYKGNYAIYPLVENNYITLHMMQEFLELSDDVLKLRDPDEASNYTVEELIELGECVRQSSHDLYQTIYPELKKLVVKRLISGRPEDDRVIVPTGSLYMEALVGTHPLLEDFKLLHRALDVKKVQAEVRHDELENLRLAARAVRGKDDDPDIDRKIVVEGAPVGVQTPTD
jgi:hypothetical protein